MEANACLTRSESSIYELCIHYFKRRQKPSADRLKILDETGLNVFVTDYQVTSAGEE
jgi:hypothetical protein